MSLVGGAWDEGEVSCLANLAYRVCEGQGFVLSGVVGPWCHLNATDSHAAELRTRQKDEM